MKVLLVAHAFPPAPASGAQRAGNLERVLREAGCEVRVVAANLGAPPNPTSPTRVTTVMPGTSGPDGLRRVGAARRALLRLARRSPAPSRDVTLGTPEAAYLDDPGPTLRRWIQALCYFPDGHIGFLWPAVRAALKEQHDVIYTTGPPITSHLVGLVTRAISGTPWIAEFRDPWLVDDAPYRPNRQRSLLTDATARGLARRCHGAADEMVTVSEGIARELAEGRRMAGRPAPHVILNGIPDLAPTSPPARTEGPVRIVHLGSLYAHRDPTAFLKSVAALREAGDWGADDVRVDFVGLPPEAPARAQIHALGVDDIVHCREWVPHEEGQALIRDSDILLLLAQGQPLQVPNKLYEYLGIRKPVLAFADDAGETAAMLRAVGSEAIVTERHTADQVREVVAACVRGARNEATMDGVDRERREEVLAGLRTSVQLARIPGLVRRVASQNEA